MKNLLIIIILTVANYATAQFTPCTFISFPHLYVQGTTYQNGFIKGTIRPSVDISGNNLYIAENNRLRADLQALTDGNGYIQFRWYVKVPSKAYYELYQNGCSNVLRTSTPLPLKTQIQCVRWYYNSVIGLGAYDHTNIFTWTVRQMPTRRNDPQINDKI